MSTDDNSGRGPSALPKVLKTAGALVVPSTMITALLFYFGWLHAYWFCYYFGVNSTVLGLSSEDYLMRSADGLFVPITVVAGFVLLIVWAFRLVEQRVPRASWVRRALAIAALVAGALLSLAGILAVFGIISSLGVTVAPLSLASGALLLMFASRTFRASGDVVRSEWLAIAEWAGVFIVVSICAFWAAANYAASVGLGRGHQLYSELHTYPNAALYSEKSLNLVGPGVVETACPNPDSTYRYRYDGLKLVLQSGDQYFFLPQDWTPQDGAAIILPRSGSVRLEFSAAAPAGSQDSFCS